MKIDNNKKDKGNIYDRIFRENAQYIFKPLIEQRLNITIASYKPLREKFAKTMEREVDFLYDITTKEKERFLLHVEFQSANEKDMILRIQEYHSLILRKYKLPIKHVVVYLGKGKSTMRHRIDDRERFDGFEMIELSALSTSYLLSAQIPEMVILALLSDYKKERIESILRLIIRKLRLLSNTDEIPKQYINHLIFLSRLRNLEKTTIKTLNNMAISFDIEKDGLYSIGVTKGEAIGVKKGEEKMLIKSIIAFHQINTPIEKIAELLDVSIEKVIVILQAHTDFKK